MTKASKYDAPEEVTPVVEDTPTPTPTLDAAPPAGEPTEINYVQWDVSVQDTDIAMVVAPWTVVVGSIMQIGSEVMTVSDVSNPDNIGVTRTAPVAHQRGDEIRIWGTVPTLVGKTVSSVSAKSVASVTVIDILGTDGKHYLIKVSHGLVKIGGTTDWRTGIDYPL